MHVTDLTDLIGMPEDAPGPARRLYRQLSDIVEAATARPARAVVQTDLRCRRRPGRKPCPGRMIVRWTAAGEPVAWRCSDCGDDGIISSWEDSPFDRRAARPAPAPFAGAGDGAEADPEFDGLAYFRPDADPAALHFHHVLRAATSADAGPEWETALPCRKRAEGSRCPGRIIVERSADAGPVSWRCSACDDQGVITSWAGSESDLRSGAEDDGSFGPAAEYTITAATAAALRELVTLAPETECAVFGMRARGRFAVLAIAAEDLDDLLDTLAFEADLIPDSPLRARLEAAYDALLLAAGAEVPDLV